MEILCSHLTLLWCSGIKVFICKLLSYTVINFYSFVILGDSFGFWAAMFTINAFSQHIYENTSNNIKNSYSSTATHPSIDDRRWSLSPKLPILHILFLLVVELPTLHCWRVRSPLISDAPKLFLRALTLPNDTGDISRCLSSNEEPRLHMLLLRTRPLSELVWTVFGGDAPPGLRSNAPLSVSLTWRMFNRGSRGILSRAVEYSRSLSKSRIFWRMDKHVLWIGSGQSTSLRTVLMSPASTDLLRLSVPSSCGREIAHYG